MTEQLPRCLQRPRVYPGVQVEVGVQEADETRQYLARESNSSEYWVSIAYGSDAHLRLRLRLRTNLEESSITGLQDFTNFLHRWQFIPNALDVRTWIDDRAYRAALDARDTRNVAA